MRAQDAPGEITDSILWLNVMKRPRRDQMLPQHREKPLVPDEGGRFLLEGEQ